MKLARMAMLLTFASNVALAGAKEEMLATDKAFSAMSAAKGAHTAFLAYMTDDARLYDGPKPPLAGKRAVAAYYAEIEKKNPARQKPVLQWMPVEAEASADGGLGWTRGTWVETGTRMDGKTFKLSGYYVTEWRKQKDGKYRFCLDIGGLDAPEQ